MVCLCSAMLMRWAWPSGVPPMRTLRVRLSSSGRKPPALGWSYSSARSRVTVAPDTDRSLAWSKASAECSLVGGREGTTTRSSPARQPTGGASRVSWRSPALAPRVRVQLVLAAPRMSSWPWWWAQRPTSESSTSWPPPRKAPSSIPTKRITCSTLGSGATILSVPSTTRLPRSSRVADLSSAKASVPPSVTCTVRARALVSTVTVRPSGMVTASSGPGTPPPQVPGSDQAPEAEALASAWAGDATASSRASASSAPSNAVLLSPVHPPHRAPAGTSSNICSKSTVHPRPERMSRSGLRLLGRSHGGVQADAAQALVAGADQRVGGGVVLLVPAAADLVEPAAAGGVAGHVQVGLERLDVEHRGAVGQVDAGEVDGAAVDGDHPDQAEGQVVGPDRGAGGEQPDPLAAFLEQERDRPQPVADERPPALPVGLPGPVEEADEVGVVEALQALQGRGVLVGHDQAAGLVGVAGGLDRRLGQAGVGRVDVPDGPELHLLQWHGGLLSAQAG